MTTETSMQFPLPRAKGCPFDPAPEFMELQANEPISRVRIWDGSTAWIVTRYADQRAVLADQRVSSDVTRPGFPNATPAQLPDPETRAISFPMMDDPEHMRIRRMLTAPFMIKRVEALRPTVQKDVDELIDAMLAGPRPVDLVTALALPVPSLVICQLLGVPYADHEFFQENSKVQLLTTSSPEERRTSMRNLTGYLNQLISEKTRNPADDLLSALAERIKNGELTQAGAATIGILLLSAGHETTANMIALMTLALLEHPDQLARIRATSDPKQIAGAVEELLRYLNFDEHGRRRVALEDIEIGGHTIKAGEGIILPSVANRDPEAFSDPGTLDLNRDARRHVAFGFGVHQCLGQPIARMELQVVVGTLFRRIPGLRLATPVSDLRFKDDNSLYGVHELPVTW